MRLPSSTLLLVLAAVVGSVNASDKSFLRQAGQDETTVGASPKYTIMHESIKAEEKSYWSRLMQETAMSVAPTPGPPSPTPQAPTREPPSPTPESPTPRPPTSPAPTPEAVTPPSPTPESPTPRPPTSPAPTPEIVIPSPVELPTEAPVSPTPASVIPTVQPVEPTPALVEPIPPAMTPNAPSPTESPVAVPTEASPTGSSPTESPPTTPVTPAPTPEGGTPSPVAAGDTIEAIIQTIPELSTLVSVLDATGLLPELGGPGPLTLFAPTNTAFEALNLPPDTPADVVTNVLLYHVVGGQIDLAVGSVPYTALNGDELVVTVSESERTVNTANIGDTYPASNGVVYIIDAVLLPPTDPSPTPAPGPAQCTLRFLEVNCVNLDGVDCSEGYGGANGSPQSVTIEYSIRNIGGGSAFLGELSADMSGPFTATQSRNFDGAELGSAFRIDSFLIFQNVPVSAGQTITVDSTIVANDANGGDCTLSQANQFTFG